MTKNIGILYYHLQLSGDPDSVLYSSIGTTSDLDGVGEDYSQTDAATYSDVYVNDNDDPCITVRHYFAQDQAHADSAAFSGCDSFSARLGVETMEVDLRYGLFMDRRTEFYFPDRIPLQLTRVVRTQDSRSRAFGIGGSHSLNIFPVGNTWTASAFTIGAPIGVLPIGTPAMPSGGTAQVSFPDRLFPGRRLDGISQP